MRYRVRADRICAIEGCEKPPRSRGWCGLHYRRWQRTGDPLGTKGVRHLSLHKRALAKFTVGDGCWLWGAPSSGYATFWYDGRTVQAHRFIYEWFIGPIPEEMQLDHLCRATNCVRPDHLEPVTQRENGRRGLKGEMTTHCPQGHEYTEENTYLQPPSGRQRNAGRVCRECKREGHRRYSLKRRERRLAETA